MGVRFKRVNFLESSLSKMDPKLFFLFEDSLSINGYFPVVWEGSPYETDYYLIYLGG